MIKPFIELTEKEHNKILRNGIKNHLTYGDLARDYPQPDWCSYPHAVAGIMGCWSLVEFMVKNESYCLNCECYLSRLTRGLK